MFRNILFAIVLVILGVSFYYSKDFQLIAAGVAVLLFGMSFLERGFERAFTGALYRLLKKVSNSLFLSFTVGMLATALLQSSSLITVITISFLSTGLLSLRSGLGIVFGANLGTTTTAWIVALLGVKLNISTLALPLIFFGIMLQSRKITLQRAFGHIALGLGGFFMGIYLMQLGFADMENSMPFTFVDANPFVVTLIAVLGGIVLTAILQSSSASMAMIITALAAGQIDFSQSLAMAIGANIGTTITALLSALHARITGKQLAIGHLIFNVLTGVFALILLPFFQLLVNKSAELLALDNAALSMRLSLFHTFFNLAGVLLIMPFIKPLERLLKKIKSKSAEEAKPKYLSINVEKVPQSAYLALYHEAHHILHLLVQKMHLTLNTQLSNRDKGFLRMLTTTESTPFKQRYYEEIKPILAEIQRVSALLSGTYKTQQFSVISRLVAEISRDFDHILKVANAQDHMEQTKFRTIYFDLLHQLKLTCQAMQQALTENEEPRAEAEMEQRKADFDVFNKKLNTRMYQLLSNNEITSLAGTTAIHSADYTKRIIHKLNRCTHLLYTVNYLEIEAQKEFEKG